MAQGLTGFSIKFMAVLMIALAAVSCGRRGGLEAPADTSVVSIDENGNEVTETAPQKPEDKPFILDPLLD